MPRSITAVMGIVELMLVYISLSISQKARDLSPTRAWKDVRFLFLALSFGDTCCTYAMMRKERSSRKISHLIVTLCIGDAVLSVAPVGQRVDDVADVPVLILKLLQDLRRQRELIENGFDRCGTERSICALTDNQKLNISSCGTLSTFPKFSPAYTSFSDQSLSWHLYIHTVSYVYLWMAVMEFLITSPQPVGRKLCWPEMSKVRASDPNSGIRQ